jgi:ABC-type dipeptide/oligopeptide/nickel transport system permease component
VLTFIFRRLLYAIPVLIGIVVVTFILARVIPGDPCRAALGERATDEICDAFAQRVGLDKPIPVQLMTYLGDVVTGDLGDSIVQRRPVTDLLGERLPVTIELSIIALMIAVCVGIPLGVWAAYRHNSASDVGTMVFANVGVSMPVFWLGLMLQFLFAVTLKDTFLALPPSGRLSPGVVSEPFYEAWGLPHLGIFEFVSNLELLNAILIWRWDVFWDAARHLILPALALATIPMAIIARMTRSSLLDTLGLDYVRTARAKGLSERSVVTRHALRNSLLPVSTIIGLSLGTLIGGAILTETIFNLTGVGKTLYDSINARDYAVVQGFTLVIAVAFVLVNLVTDIVYTFLDPRVRVT